MPSQPGKQTIAIHILHSIWRSKCNQAKKLGQLIEYNMKNIFLEKKHAQNMVETIPRFFIKKSKLSISLDQWSNIYTVCF